MNFTVRNRLAQKSRKDKEVLIWQKKNFTTSDDYEHGIVIRSLNDEKTDLMNQGKSTDAVDDLIIKVGTAPKKKFKVISKDRSDAER